MEVSRCLFVKWEAPLKLELLERPFHSKAAMSNKFDQPIRLHVLIEPAEVNRGQEEVTYIEVAKRHYPTILAGQMATGIVLGQCCITVSA